MTQSPEKKKAEALLLCSQEKPPETDIGEWDFLDKGEVELVVGRVDEGDKRRICEEALQLLKVNGFAMNYGFRNLSAGLTKKTGNYRFDAPIGGLQDAFYLTVNESDLNELCKVLKKHKG